MNATSGQRPLEATATPAFPARRTLLIVDDDEGPRKSLQFVFKNDYEVLLAASGLEALEVIKSHSVDVAILDIRMMGMSGIELLGKLKALDPAIEAIMLTGYETVETIREALRLGACDYLSKPYDVETIRGSVANAMERRSLSEEIRSTHQKMASLQVELQQQAVREEITRNKGEIYASVLHDINGPLTIIAGYIQLINMDLEHLPGNRNTETIKDQLRQINRQVTHCIEISQRYLSFLRRKPSEKAKIQVNRALEDLRALLKAHPSRQRNDLQIQNLSGDPVVSMNGADLIQVLLNLAINGFQSTTEIHTVTISGCVIENPVSITAPDSSPTDRVVAAPSFDAGQTFIKLVIEDNGPGIPTEIIGRIFDPFFSTKAEKGTGLGLSIVQRLVTEASGAIHLHSELGKGTTFHIYLPAERLR